MKNTLMCFILILCAIILHAEKVAEFPEMMQPARIKIDGNEMFVVDSRSKIEVYSLSEQMLLREISKKGQGPGEFQYLPFLKIFPDSLFLGAYTKVMVFSKDGKLIEENRQFPVTKALPAGDNYVSFGTVREGEDIYRTVNLIGSDMKQIKELHRHLRVRRKGGINPIRDYMNFDTLGNRIFIADSREGFVIEVFDSSGEKEYIIDKELEKIRITNEFKTAYIEQLTSRPGGQGQEWKTAVDQWGVEYDRFFPDIREFQVADDRIYVQTYKTEQRKTEFIILDLKGSSSQSVFLPLYEEGSLVDKYVYTFHKGDYYYLKYNDDKEMWELHRLDLSS
ncbi:MAG: hypothetical protein JSV17_16520 [Candidatus Aminicenantes bacterium]|nr:MAG: hypothetical protein JSV17_16520 [Candidatus Aminicenantes bacterium]